MPMVPPVTSDSTVVKAVSPVPSNPILLESAGVVVPGVVVPGVVVLGLVGVDDAGLEQERKPRTIGRIKNPFSIFMIIIKLLDVWMSMND